MKTSNPISSALGFVFGFFFAEEHTSVEKFPGSLSAWGLDRSQYEAVFLFWAALFRAFQVLGYPVLSALYTLRQILARPGADQVVEESYYIMTESGALRDRASELAHGRKALGDVLGLLLNRDFGRELSKDEPCTNLSTETFLRAFADVYDARASRNNRLDVVSEVDARVPITPVLVWFPFGFVVSRQSGFTLERSSSGIPWLMIEGTTFETVRLRELDRMLVLEHDDIKVGELGMHRRVRHVALRITEGGLEIYARQDASLPAAWCPISRLQLGYVKTLVDRLSVADAEKLRPYL